MELRQNAGILLLDYVPYVGATTSLNLGSQNFITTGTLGAGVSTLSSVITPTINDTATQNLTLFGTTQVGNTTDGKSLYIYRKAAEGDNYLQFYIDQYRFSQIKSSGGLNISATGDLKFLASGDNACYTYNFKVGQYSNANMFFKHYGRLTSTGADDNIQWQLEAGGDFALTRADANVSKFRIDMPVDLGSNILGAGAITGTSLTDTSLTITRIPYVSTGGLLTDTSKLVWDNTNQRLDIILNTGANPTHLVGTALGIVGADNAMVRVGMSSYGIAGMGAFAQRHARGTLDGGLSAIQDTDTIFSLEGWGYGATGYSASPRAMIRGYAGETWTDSSQASYLSFWTTPSTVIVPVRQWTITKDGHLYSGLTGNLANDIITSGKLQFNASTEYLNSTNSGYVDYHAATQHRFNNTVNLGGATNYINIATDGDITWGGTSKKKLTLRPNLIQSQAKIAGVPTEVYRGVNVGYSMPIWSDPAAVNEQLFFRMRIPQRWDGTTDPQFGMMITITGTEDVGDKFKFELSWQTTVCGGTTVMGTTDSDCYTEQTIIMGGGTAYTAYCVFFTLNADDVTNPIIAGEMLQGRVRRVAASANEVSNEVVIWDWVSIWCVDKVYIDWSVEANKT